MAFTPIFDGRPNLFRKKYSGDGSTLTRRENEFESFDAEAVSP